MCEKIKSGKSKIIDSTPYKYTNILKLKVNIIFLCHSGNGAILEVNALNVIFYIFVFL